MSHTRFLKPFVRTRKVNSGHDAAVKDSGWTPKALRRYTLLSLALLFAILAIVIGVLYAISRLNDGLCNAQSKDHYLWTYAPTALFTLIAAIWSQVEYRALQMQPWRALAEGQKAASQSVLLDYISQWNVIVLFKAIKWRHVVVSAALCASLLLQGLIVLSTSLVTLSEIQIQQSGAQLTVVDKFIPDGALFDPSQVDARPAALVLAYGQTRLQHAPGTTLTEAYQQFSAPQNLGAGVLSSEAEVEVLSSVMKCEPAELNIAAEEVPYDPPLLTMSSVPVETGTQSVTKEMVPRAFSSGSKLAFHSKIEPIGPPGSYTSASSGSLTGLSPVTSSASYVPVPSTLQSGLGTTDVKYIASV